MDALFSQRETWFTADLHLGHERILELCARPFGTLAEMHEALLDNWNSRVQERDTVWVLGDWALGTIAETLALTSKFNGTKILVAGNHDRCFAGYNTGAKLAEWTERYREAGFSAVVTGAALIRPKGPKGLPLPHALRRQFGGPVTHRVLLSHFPRTGESSEGKPDRYAEFRPPQPRGRTPAPWVIHGHVHNGWTISGAREVNVGVDVWDFAPVSATTLCDLIDEGMPDCTCESAERQSVSAGVHSMGMPGCVINGGPDAIDEP